MLLQLDAMPLNALIAEKEGPSDDGHILAEGEVTGHHHRLRGPQIAFFRPDDAGPGGGFLAIGRPARLGHEEHAEIAIPPGDYKLVRQREYEPAPPQEGAGGGLSRLMAD